MPANIRSAEAFATMQTSAPAFPPSFTDNGFFYGAVLFGLLWAFTICIAMVIRSRALNRMQGFAFDHPVACQRRILSLIHIGIICGTGPACLELLMWNEPAVGAVFRLIGVSDQAGLGVIVSQLRRVGQLAFFLFLFLSVNHGWVTWFFRRLKPSSPPVLLDPEADRMLEEFFPEAKGLMDFKSNFPSPAVPYRILGLCLALSALATFAKWYVLG